MVIWILFGHTVKTRETKNKATVGATREYVAESETHETAIGAKRERRELVAGGGTHKAAVSE